MLKTHVIHVIADGLPPAQAKLQQFEQLVDQFRADAKHDVRRTEFFVNPVFGQTAVTLTAIITWTDRVHYAEANLLTEEQRRGLAAVAPDAIAAGVR